MKTGTTDKLTPETHEGKFTFGCKMDNRIFEVKGKPGLLSIENVSYYITVKDTMIYISVRSRRCGKDYNFDFGFKYIKGAGIYSLKNFPYTDYLKFGSMDSAIGHDYFQTTEEHPVTMKITWFDGSFNPYFRDAILSGTFDGEMINDSGKVVRVTEGRFDIGQ